MRLLAYTAVFTASNLLRDLGQGGIQSLLTLGSIVLAVVNVGVMWAMAHDWRYAWHANLALQLLWLPYDFLTRQYGLLMLGAVLACVSLRACALAAMTKRNGTSVPSRPRHRRARRRLRPRLRGHAARSPAKPPTAPPASAAPGRPPVTPSAESGSWRAPVA